MVTQLSGVPQSEPRAGRMAEVSLAPDGQARMPQTTPVWSGPNCRARCQSGNPCGDPVQLPDGDGVDIHSPQVQAVEQITLSATDHEAQLTGVDKQDLVISRITQSVESGRLHRGVLDSEAAGVDEVLLLVKQTT